MNPSGKMRINLPHADESDCAKKFQGFADETKKKLSEILIPALYF